ncbi:MAG TPA: hypothetical protein VFV63_00550, partial [Ilumatobacteraceae bacterium]|nr:hypothetical protein [Ilumatobacteraceae bacterium]
TTRYEVQCMSRAAAGAGVSPSGLAALVIAVTAVASDENVTSWVYRIVAALLAALAVLTVLTGARTRIIWFKVCPVLLTSTAVLLVTASVL